MVLITLSGATNTSQQSCFKSNKIRENPTDDFKESFMIFMKGYVGESIIEQQHVQQIKIVTC